MVLPYFDFGHLSDTPTAAQTKPENKIYHLFTTKKNGLFSPHNMNFFWLVSFLLSFTRRYSTLHRPSYSSPGVLGLTPRINLLYSNPGSPNKISLLINYNYKLNKKYIYEKNPNILINKKSTPPPKGLKKSKTICIDQKSSFHSLSKSRGGYLECCRHRKDTQADSLLFYIG